MYRVVDCGFWDDPKVRPLDVVPKLLLNYLFTNRHSNFTGLYYIIPAVMAHDLNLSVKVVDKSLSILIPQFALYDESTQLLWVKKMFKRQCPRPNAKHLTGVVNHIATLHPSPLICAFLQEYCACGIPMDKVSVAYQQGTEEPYQDQDQDQDKYQDQDSVPDTPSATLRVLPVPDNSKAAQLEKIKADFENLAEKFPHLHIQEEFERWNDWMDAKGKTFKSYPAAFRNWCNADWKKPAGGPRPPHKPSLAERLAQRDKGK